MCCNFPQIDLLMKPYYVNINCISIKYVNDRLIISVVKEFPILEPRKLNMNLAINIINSCVFVISVHSDTARVSLSGANTL